MLTDISIKSLKAKEKPYKVTDRDGLYVLVSPTGSMSFRYDYRINGRRETIVLGRYGRTGLSLAWAREKCIDAKRLIAQGISPAIEKQREKRRIAESKSFGQFGEKWLTSATMADSTRAMRRSTFERELLPVWRKRLLSEITPGDLRVLWTIPKQRMKRSKPHNVYLSTQMLDILIALKTCAGNSRYFLPSRYDADAPMSRATFNRVTYSVVEQARKDGLPLEAFTVHDLRRTGATLLNELGFNSDWIEKCLAHEDGRSSRGIYNKAEYEVQRRHMMQEWSNTVDAWIAGVKYVPILSPPTMPILVPDPSL